MISMEMAHLIMQEDLTRQERIEKLHQVVYVLKTPISLLLQHHIILKHE